MHRFLQAPPNTSLTYDDFNANWDADIHMMSTYCFLSEEEKKVFIGTDSSFEEMLIAIGYGKITVKDVIKKSTLSAKDNNTEEYEDISHQVPQKISSQKTGVLVSGLDNVLVFLSKC